MHHRSPSETSTDTTRLVEQHAPLIRKGLEWIPHKVRASVAEGDLLGFGALGLFAALRLYNPEAKVPFGDYAVFKIRGAMLDGVRGLDWFPRGARKRHGLRMCGEGLRLASEAQLEADQEDHDLFPDGAEDQLHAAIASLPTEQRLVITKTYFRGLSLAETAAELQLTTGAVKHRLQTALATLRETISCR